MKKKKAMPLTQQSLRNKNAHSGILCQLFFHLSDALIFCLRASFKVLFEKWKNIPWGELAHTPYSVPPYPTCAIHRG